MSQHHGSFGLPLQRNLLAGAHVHGLCTSGWLVVTWNDPVQCSRIGAFITCVMIGVAAKKQGF